MVRRLMLDFLSSPLLSSPPHPSLCVTVGLDWNGCGFRAGKCEAAKEAPAGRFLRLPAWVRPV
jgi:hypothetical protein